MPLIVWSESLSVYVSEMDDQHKVLFNFTNELYDAVMSAKKDTLGNVLSGMVNYTVYHFSTEEQLMEKYAYPDMQQHRDAHAAFTERVMNYFDQYQNGAGSDMEGVLAFLKDWWINHIMETDVKLGLFLHSKGIV